MGELTQNIALFERQGGGWWLKDLRRCQREEAERHAAE
jgi:hypothetical protein